MGVMKRPPAGLGPSGRALWRETLSEYGLNPAESLMLTQLCRAADRLDAIETELSGPDLTLEGSTGQPVAHPLPPGPAQLVRRGHRRVDGRILRRRPAPRDPLRPYPQRTVNARFAGFGKRIVRIGGVFAGTPASHLRRLRKKPGPDLACRHRRRRRARP